ncbi:DUF3021 domain-containing protein [Lysinibacillus sp. 54212]|uniref:DUF3021 domain-containing protein n=1 Tax=Lysinibacillus sp. 54212 TaxID=3119829 RepID=UPI002FC6153E
MFEIIRFSTIGLLIGLSSSYTFQALFSLNETVTGKELLKEYIIAGVLGIVIGWISLIFRSERLGFTAQLSIHFAFVTICVGVAGYIGEWYDITNINTMIGVLVWLIIIYTVSWGISLVLIKKDIKQLNRTIQNRRKSLE